MVFGTQYVYADLEGGDILYFGPWVMCGQLRNLWRQEVGKFKTLEKLSICCDGSDKELYHQMRAQVVIEEDKKHCFRLGGRWPTFGEQLMDSILKTFPIPIPGEPEGWKPSIDFVHANRIGNDRRTRASGEAL